MAYIYAVPPWFCGYDALIEFIFAVVTLLVGIYAYKVYSLTGQRSSYLFSISFFFIAFSYLILAIYNLFLLTDLNQKICTIANISNVTLFTNTQMYLHLLFYLTGLMILLYITLRVSCKKVFSLVAILVFSAFVLTLQNPFGVYIIGSILLTYISGYYLQSYLKKKTSARLIVFLGFGLLLLANILFIFAFDYGAYYIVGHTLMLIAYMLILINLVLLLRKK